MENLGSDGEPGGAPKSNDRQSWIACHTLAPRDAAPTHHPDPVGRSLFII
jgi:hypothetical protein